MFGAAVIEFSKIKPNYMFQFAFDSQRDYPSVTELVEGAE